MEQRDKYQFQMVIIQGLLFFIIYILVTAIERDIWFNAIAFVYAPLIALSLGAYGLRSFGKDTDYKDDRFNALNVWLSIGLIMLSFAEIAILLIMMSLNPSQMTLILALVHLPGLSLWGMGTLQYFQSLNSSLKFIESDHLWSGLFIITSISSLGLIAGISVIYQSIDILETIILSPIIAGLLLITIIIVGLIWTFRKGMLVRPIIFILGAFLIYCIRVSLWLFGDTTQVSAIDGLLAIESFTLCGGAILLARTL